MTSAAENADAAPAAKRKPQFTVYHGFALSLALHAAVIAPIVAHQLIPLHEDLEPLAIDFEENAASERQADEKIEEQTKGQEVEKKQQKAKEAPPPQKQQQQQQQAVDPIQDSPQEPVTDDMDAPPPPPPPRPKQEEKKLAEEQPVEAATPAAAEMTPNPGAENLKGDVTQQKAQTKQIERAQIQAYSVLLSKRIRAHLVYPNEGRRSGLQGDPKVAFTILSDGRLDPDSLKLVKSSGQPKLDTSELQTIRDSAPFDPPPTEMHLIMDVEFFKER